MNGFAAPIQISDSSVRSIIDIYTDQDAGANMAATYPAASVLDQIFSINVTVKLASKLSIIGIVTAASFGQTNAIDHDVFLDGNQISGTSIMYINTTALTNQTVFIAGNAFDVTPGSHTVVIKARPTQHLPQPPNILDPVVVNLLVIQNAGG